MNLPNNTWWRKLWGIALIVGMLNSCSRNQTAMETPTAPRVLPKGSVAKFLQRVTSLPTAHQRLAVVDSFFAAHSPADFPIIEDSTCYFFFRGKGAQSVVGDFNQWRAGRDPFIAVDSTDLFYVAKTFPLEARLDYKIVVAGKWILDPLNPRVIWGGFGPNSELAMPRYEYPAEILYQPDIPHGTVVEWSFQSRVLNNTRQVWVYLPAEYEAHPQNRYPVLYVQDGGEYIRLANMVNVLDNLIASQRIRPIITVFVNPVERNQEYWLNDAYVTMLVQELVPAVDSTWRTLPDPKNRGIMGASLGGVVSLYAALKYPEVFRKVGSQSGALWIEQQRIITLYQQTDLPPLIIYLDWGTFEEGQEAVHRQFRTILVAAGHTVRTERHPEGHSWGNWRAHIDNILVTFWGK